MKRLGARQQGVSLIEAVVAVGVMAFGMLALVGVQATLHGSSDLARQRTEAMRIAQETMEGYRSYAALDGPVDPDIFYYADIGTKARAAFGAGADTAYDGRLNTTFSLTITAPAVVNSARMQPVAVTVDWTDRNNQFQAVELRSLISGVPPELAGSLALPPARVAFAAPWGRHRSIPLQAQSLPGIGLSAFRPPQSGGRQVVWMFNNVTGLITGKCELDAARALDSLTDEEIGACSNNTTAQLVSGFVRFAAGEPTVAEAEEPTGGTLNLDMVLTLTTDHPQAPVCFDDATADAATAAARREVSYYCLVYSNEARTWAGRTRIAPRAFERGAAWVIANAAVPGEDRRIVCRYTRLAHDALVLDPDTGKPLERNVEHPLDYLAAGSAPGDGLTNQNFLVIGAAFACPTEAPAEGDLFNSNTLPHQTGVAPYTNP